MKKVSPRPKTPRSLVQKLRHVPFKSHTACRICGTRLVKPVINLPDFPLTEIYVPQKHSEKLARLDQGFCYCENCGHGQLARTIPAEVLYGDNYFTRTSGSGSAKTAIDDFLKFVMPMMPTKVFGSILEIGCNDLYTLEKLKDRARVLVGIDPIWRGREDQVKDPKIRVLGEFIEQVDLTKLDISPGVVVCSHTLEHIDDPVSLLRSLIASVSDKTLCFFQFPGLDPLVEDGRFDQLHHQHLNYFTLRSVIAALESAGAELLDYRFNYHHWGALMIAFRKARGKTAAVHKRFARQVNPLTKVMIRARWDIFARTMAVINEQLGALLESRKVYGFGAALMLPLLSYHLPQLVALECIIDDDPQKQGLYYINFPLEIVPVSSIQDLATSAVVVTAINSKQNVRAITRKLIELNVRDIFIPTNVL